MSEPIYHDGKPQNLEAAAFDALEWLRLMRSQPNKLILIPKDRDALARCITALESFLPEGDPQDYEVTQGEVSE